MTEKNNIRGALVHAAGSYRESYEVAAWYRTIEYDAGTVPLTAAYRSGSTREIETLGATITGTVTDSHFPALFGGVAVTDGKRPGDIGQQADVPVRFAGYVLADGILEHDNPHHTGHCLVTSVDDNGDWYTVHTDGRSWRLPAYIVPLYSVWGDPSDTSKDDDQYGRACGYAWKLVEHPTPLELAVSDGASRARRQLSMPMRGYWTPPTEPVDEMDELRQVYAAAKAWATVRIADELDEHRSALRRLDVSRSVWTSYERRRGQTELAAQSTQNR